MRILVVDDEQVMRDLIFQVLRMKGHEIVLATNGKEAVAQAAADSFDAIFLDAVMPELDGVEAFKQIQARDPHATVVIMTGFAVEDKIREAMALGAFDFLYKPFNIVELMTILEKMKKRESLKPLT